MQVSIQATSTSQVGKTMFVEPHRIDVFCDVEDGSLLIKGRATESKGNGLRGGDVSSTHRETWVRLTRDEMVQVLADAVKWHVIRKWGIDAHSNAAELAKIAEHLKAALSEVESLQSQSPRIKRIAS